MDLDEAIERIGGFGPGQKRILLYANSVHVFAALHVLCYSFIADDPGWTCPRGLSDPAEACEMVKSGSCTPIFNSSFTSIVTEWDLVCDKSSHPNLSQSAYFLGLLFGAFIFGRLSDMLGRKKIFIISIFLQFLAGLGYGLAFNFYFFLLMRLCTAIANAGLIMTSIILSVEIVSPGNRNFAGMLGSLLFGFSFSLMALLAYFITNWRHLVVLSSMLGLIPLFFFRFLPESPRWLAVNGRMEDALSVLSQLAQANGVEMPAISLKKPDTTRQQSPGLTSLLTGPAIRRLTASLFVVWLTNCMVYYFLTMRSKDLGSNRFLSFALSGLVEVPGILLAYKLLNRLGRRWTHGGFLFSSGVACLLWSIFYKTGHLSMGPSVALLGKFAVSGSFAVIYLYTTEVFPTQVRNAGLGVSSIGARLGGIMAPLILMTVSICE